jgi:putative SOS response-associated peptidase YedK
VAIFSYSPHGARQHGSCRGRCTFTSAFNRTGCIISASGYYEWQDTPDNKQPHFFTRIDGQVISFAGLWDEWKDRATGETVKSCTMIITEPNAMVVEVHDRMPVVLDPTILRHGLENEAGLEIWCPWPKACFSAGRCQSV